MKWIKVSEELPQVHGKLLVFTGDWNGVMTSEYHGRFIEDSNAPIEENRPYKSLDKYVTHWMYLPDLPYETTT